jgi:hypothetical protein
MEDKMGRVCSTHGAKRNAYKVSMGKPEGKILLGRHTCRYKDNIEMDLEGIRMEWYGADSSGLGRGPVEGSYEHVNEHSRSI